MSFCLSKSLLLREPPLALSRSTPAIGVESAISKKKIQESPGHEMHPDSPYPQFFSKSNKAFPKIASFFFSRLQKKTQSVEIMSFLYSLWFV